MNHPVSASALLVVLGMAHGCVFAAGPEQVRAPEQRVYTYAIELDSNGMLTRLSPHETATDAIGRQLEARIVEWIFEPGESDGAKAATSTYLRVVVAPRAREAGAFDLVSATTGPAPARLTRPEFPLRDQRAGLAGSVVLKLDIDAQGRVERAEVHDLAGNISRTMAQAAKASASEWRFTPEMIDGRAVASSILWPVCFLGAQSSASDCAWQGPDAQRFSSKTVLPLNPAARLVSPLALQGR